MKYFSGNAHTNFDLNAFEIIGITHLMKKPIFTILVTGCSTLFSPFARIYKPALLKFIVFFYLCIATSIISSNIRAQSIYKVPANQLAEQEKWRKVIEKQPNNLEAHRNYLDLFYVTEISTTKQYDLWIEKYPNSFVIPFAIGKAYFDKESPKAKSYLLKALSIKPNLAEAWHLLGIDAQFRGDNLASTEYFQKAAKADPENPDYSFSYAFSYKDINKLQYDSLSFNTVRRFPASKEAVLSLYLLASSTNDVGLKSAYYQELYRLFLKHPSDETNAYVGEYFSFLLKTNPVRALELAVSMLSEFRSRTFDWNHKYRVAKSFTEARNFLNTNQPEEAVKSLAEIKLTSEWNHSFIDAEETLHIFQAEAVAAANHTQLAYDSLAKYYSQMPSKALRIAAITHGKKLGLDEAQFDTCVAMLRHANAKKFPEFALQPYSATNKLSIKDFKGKVTLLTFWFPGCGPCRNEFPHFESVIKEFSADEVAYLGINGESKQDEFVVPFMKSSGYSFIALHDDVKWDKRSFGFNSRFPTNYLIDKNGKVIFSEFMISELQDEESLELMIKELLNEKN